MTSKQFFIYGLHAVHALLEKEPGRITHLHIQKGREDQKMTALISIANQCGIGIESVSRQTLDKLTHDANHQGVLAYCKQASVYQESDLKDIITRASVSPFFLILDGVQDPHNLGACFRSADAAGVHAIIAPKDRAVGITPIVSKVASGAAEIVPFVQVTNLVRAMEILKEQGVWLYGASAQAQLSLYQANLTGPVGIVLGAEGVGLRRLTEAHCDFLINIPMLGSVSSLNVSVAAGVCLFERVRQTQK